VCSIVSKYWLEVHHLSKLVCSAGRSVFSSGLGYTATNLDNSPICANLRQFAPICTHLHQYVSIETMLQPLLMWIADRLPGQIIDGPGGEPYRGWWRNGPTGRQTRAVKKKDAGG